MRMETIKLVLFSLTCVCGTTGAAPIEQLSITKNTHAFFGNLRNTHAVDGGLARLLIYATAHSTAEMEAVFAQLIESYAIVTES